MALLFTVAISSFSVSNIIDEGTAGLFLIFLFPGRLTSGDGITANIITEIGVQLGVAILEAMGDASNWASQAGVCTVFSLLLACLHPMWMVGVLAGSYFLCFEVSQGMLYSLRWWLAKPLYYYARFFFG